MDLILAAVDGTGPRNQSIYAEAFEISFVRTVWRSCPATLRFYWRGPTDLGFETKPLAEAVRSHVEASLAVWRMQHSDPKPVVLNLLNERVMQVAVSSVGSSPKICLVGYSRGAAAVIFAAKQLAPLSIDYLVLFDAVDRSPTLTSATKIPTNVKSVWHVRRDPTAGSREAFGNCGMEVNRATTKYQERCFMTTHGGAGGTPWCTDPSFKQDFIAKTPNGKSFSWLAKPCTRWRETVREVAAGSALEQTVFQVNYLMSRGNFITAARNTIIQSLTNLTFAEDLEGSKEAWNWIAPKLLSEGIISSSRWDGMSIQPTPGR